MSARRLPIRHAPENLARVARNLAEAIDALYRSNAAPRSRERLVDLVQVQVEHAMRLGARHHLGDEWPPAEREAK